ncbi:MAG: hypothetical protein KC561_21100, partial [Myxococcales bacterium]|nr:hypothetical protein [Myxococcales bacterium]
YGAPYQFNRVRYRRLDEGVFEAATAPSHLAFEFPIFDGQPALQFDLFQARIRATVRRTDGGIRTTESNETRPESNVMTGSLGAVTPMDPVFATFDQLLRGCECADVNPNQPVLTFGPNVGTGKYNVACTDNRGSTVNDCTDEDGVCSYLGTLCLLIPAASAYVDYDANGDGAPESATVGMCMGLAEADVSFND